jgi:hypothetical protein
MDELEIVVGAPTFKLIVVVQNSSDWHIPAMTIIANAAFNIRNVTPLPATIRGPSPTES